MVTSQYDVCKAVKICDTVRRSRMGNSATHIPYLIFYLVKQLQCRQKNSLSTNSALLQQNTEGWEGSTRRRKKGAARNFRAAHPSERRNTDPSRAPDLRISTRSGLKVGEVPENVRRSRQIDGRGLHGRPHRRLSPLSSPSHRSLGVTRERGRKEKKKQER